MKTKNEDIICMEVASKIVECIAENYGENFQDHEVLEGIFLAMQMIGGPRKAAQLINSCSVKVG